MNTIRSWGDFARGLLTAFHRVEKIEHFRPCLRPSHGPGYFVRYCPNELIDAGAQLLHGIFEIIPGIPGRMGSIADMGNGAFN